MGEVPSDGEARAGGRRVNKPHVSAASQEDLSQFNELLLDENHFDQAADNAALARRYRVTTKGERL
jgi:hypothetical protein